MTSVSATLEALTNERLLRRNVALNLAGWLLPAAAALISIPLLARNLAPARFGLVALAWAAIGMFSIFDFGIGRVLTRLVAERLAMGEPGGIADLVWSSTWILLGLTSILAVIGVVAAPHIADVMMHVPADVHNEAVGVVRLLSLAIPPLAHGVALRGVLEAGQRFRRINQIRIPLGVVSYAGPLLAIPLGGDARVAVGIIVLGRVIYWLVHVPFLADIAPELPRPRLPRQHAVRELAHVGGWITVSNVISPIIVQGDRVTVAMLFPIAASGWYGAASEIATKQLLFSAALAPVLFSALSAAVRTAPTRAIDLAERAARISLLALLPVVIVLVAFAGPGLQLWLGPAYVPEASAVLRWLAVAVYVNTFGQVPYFVLQSGEGARPVGVIHLIELPLYVAALFGGAAWLGVQGVAIVWFARMAIDAGIMWTVLYRRMPLARDAIGRLTRLWLACALLVTGAMTWGFTR